MKLRTPPPRYEHYEQVDFFRWLAEMMVDYPDIGLAYAIPNGARTSKSVAKRLKAEGMKAGAPDICWPVPRYPYHGLYIEMKRVRGGSVSKEQRHFINRLRALGYLVEVCKGFEAAKIIFCEYLAMPPWPPIAKEETVE